MNNFINFYRKLAPSRFRTLVFRLRLRWSILSQVLFMKVDELCLIAKPTLAQDGFSTRHFVEYLGIEPFYSAFQKSLTTLPITIQPKFSQITYRAHICFWAYESTKHLSGEMASFGVNYGVLEKTIAELHENMGSREKKFYLFDTWGETAGSHEDYKKDIYQEVIDRFKGYNFIQLVRGLIPDSFAKVEIHELSLLLIDLNGWEAELEVLNSYYDKVISGGIIYFDDYGWDYPRLRNVVDKFLSNKPETLLHFASGNAILVKS